MAGSLPQLVIIAPLLAMGSYGWASDTTNPFDFDSTELDSIRFTRSDTDFLLSNQLGAQLQARVNDQSEADLYEDTLQLHGVASRQTQFSFKLKPKRPDFSREGAYGLGLFSQPRLDVESRLMGGANLNQSISALHEGFQYSAGLKVEHEDAIIDGTAYVSSSLLGLSYGRLGRLWYGGIDVNLEKFSDNWYGSGQPDILSLDVTTGRRLGFTGLTAHSPLWLLSVQGNFDVQDEVTGEQDEKKGAWSLNPSLLWQQPGFTFSAQMQLPVEVEAFDEAGQPDYRLRAVFEKQFK